MDKSNINKEMVQRYYAGTATPSECELIERWLTEDESEDTLLPEKQLQEIEARIWQRITPKPAFSKARLSYVTWLTAAASIVFVLGLLYWTNEIADPKMYRLGGNSPSSLDLHGLNFRLLGKGDATLTAEHGKEVSDLNFCGAVEIVNNSDSDIDYMLTSTCKKSNYTRKNITLKKGKTYIAMHNHYHTDEVVILRKEHLIEFPDMVPNELRADLSI
ncbi:hypothetical protein D3C87_99200 [compost metagenome]